MNRAERRRRQAKPQKQSPVVAFSVIRVGAPDYHPLIQDAITTWATELHGGARVECACCEAQFALTAPAPPAFVVAFEDTGRVFAGGVCDQCAQRPDRDIAIRGAERYRPGLASVHLIDPANAHDEGGRA